MRLTAAVLASVLAAPAAAATATVTPTRTPTGTATRTPTPRFRWVMEHTVTPWAARPHGRTPIHTAPAGGYPTVTCSPTPEWVEYDTAYTPTVGFTPRLTARPRTPPAGMTPFVVGMSYAARDRYGERPVRFQGWPYGQVWLAVTDSGPTATPTRTPRTPTLTRTRTAGFTRTATATPGGPTPPPDLCAGWPPYGTCTPTPRGPTATRTTSRTPTPQPATMTPTPPPSPFTVTVAWATVDGRSGAGQAIPYSANASAFWFFSADNPELYVAVLPSACPLNGYIWVKLFGGTNVQVDVTVTDTRTGASKSWHVAQGVNFPYILDNQFERCP